VTSQIWCQGNPVDDSVIDWAQSRAAHYGDGCFTTGVVQQGVWLNGQAHLARMDWQMARLRFAPVSYDRWMDAIEPALIASQTYPQPRVIKLWVVRQGALGYQPMPNSTAHIMVSIAPMPAGYDCDVVQRKQKSIVLGVCQTPATENAALAGIKHLNRLDSVLARSEVVEAGWDEGVMLDQHQRLVCATQGNLVWYAQGQFFTPSLHKAGVAGLGLHTWQTAATTLPWYEVSTTVEAMMDAECVCVCNGVRGIQWVTSIELSNTSQRGKGKLMTKPNTKQWPDSARKLAEGWHSQWLKAFMGAPALRVRH
jgi:4-amino-4-deoxychorismate lyase